MAITGTTDLGDGKLAVTVDHDPTAVATDCPIGSLIIDINGVWYHKNDDGSTTNISSIGIQGPQGLFGPQGNFGIQGPQGFQGEIGSQGLQGFQGEIGFQGLTGSQGNQGTQGGITDQYALSTGVVWGLTLQIHPGDTSKYDINPGEAVFIDNFTTPGTTVRTVVSLPSGITSITPDWGAANRHPVYVFLKPDGTVLQTLDAPSLDDFTRYAFLGILSLDGAGNEVKQAYQLQCYVYNVATRFVQFCNCLGTFNVSGNLYSPASLTGPQMQVQRSAGQIFRAGANYGSDVRSPDVPSTDVQNPVPFFPLYHVSGNWYYPTAPVTTIDPDYYDNLTDLVAMTPGYYQIKVVYFTPTITFIQYGQVQYPTMADAIVGISNDSIQINDTLVSGLVARCFLIVQAGCTDLTVGTQAKFVNASKFGLAGASGGGGGGGEVNTASNIGTGTGFFFQKSGVDLQFMGIAPNSGAQGILITEDDINNVVLLGLNYGSQGNQVCAGDDPRLNVGRQGPQGFQGEVGSQGLQGEVGPQGNQGFQGLVGSQGNQGNQGFQGLIGSQGNQGNQGWQGLVGSQGNQGNQGFQGLVGSQGNQGNQGFQGLTGSQGNQGNQGFQGLTGSQGNQGNQGWQGLTGSQGNQGLQGLTGSQGNQGNQGWQGLQGNQGFQGLTGSQGNQGNQGWQGLTGSQGNQGLSGSQGNQGFQGLSGSQGNQGNQGRQGWQGFQGSVGSQGNQGFQGLVGSQGNQGNQGFQGPGFQGNQGFQGLTGSQGNQGRQGNQGVQGWQGTDNGLTQQQIIARISPRGIILDTTTRKLQLSLAGAVASNQCPFVVSYADYTTTTYTFGANDGVTNGATPVDAVLAPAASTSRDIKSLMVYNADSAQVILSVIYNDNGTTRVIWRGTLSVGDTLQYAENGFTVTDATGQLKVTGVDGTQGPIGSQGNQGNQGFQGLIGFQGNQGNQGRQGWQGWQGYQGFGFQGNQGNQGWQGLTGSGVQGPQGFQGRQGWQGFQGYQGTYTPSELNTQSGTTYTLAIGDAFDLVTLNNSSAIAVTIPLNSSVPFPVPTVIDIIQLGTGLVTFSPAGGVTLNSKSGVTSMNGQYSGCSLVKTATDTWELIGVGTAPPSRMTQITSNMTTTSTTWTQLLSSTFTTNQSTAFLHLDFSVCANCSNSNAAISYQVTVDGTDVGVTQNWVSATGNPTSAALTVRVPITANASHTVVVNWRTATGTASIDPTQSHSSGVLLMHANLVIEELPS